MNAWTGKITVAMPRRRATVKVDRGMAHFNNIEEGTHECHVLGLFQCNDGLEDVSPYFICELHSGQNIYADPTNVTFVDTDKNGEIIEEGDVDDGV